MRTIKTYSKGRPFIMRFSGLGLDWLAVELPFDGFSYSPAVSPSNGTESWQYLRCSKTQSKGSAPNVSLSTSGQSTLQERVVHHNPALPFRSSRPCGRSAGSPGAHSVLGVAEFLPWKPKSEERLQSRYSTVARYPATGTPRGREDGASRWRA